MSKAVIPFAEEAEEKMEDEGNDTAKEDGAAATEAVATDGAVAGTDELNDQAEPGEGQNAATDTASKEDDADGGNIQEEPEPEASQASAPVKKASAKPVSKLAATKGGAAMKAKTKSQTAAGGEKGSGPKKKGKPAPIEFPDTK